LLSTDNFFIVSVYIAPSESDRDFNVTLDRLSAIICMTGACIISGDFNAKSLSWGSPRTDWRGSVLERWAAGLDLRIMNMNIVNEPTCVRTNGSSIIDLTWSSASICRLFSNWCVLLRLVVRPSVLFIILGSLLVATRVDARYPR